MINKTWITVCIVLLLISCTYTGVNEKNNCKTSSFSDLALSNTTNSNINVNDSVNQFILDLNKSNYKKAIESFSRFFTLDTMKYNNYFTLVPKFDSGYNIKVFYNAYRISEYSGDIDKNSLIRILVDNSTSSSNYSDTCLENVIQMELNYLSCYLPIDTNKAIKNVNEFKSYLKRYPHSKRVKYLWANLLADFMKNDSCISVYKKLIGDFYYELPCYKRIINYYWKENIDSALFYSKKLSEKFPQSCNLMSIVQYISSSDSLQTMIECKKCYQSISQKDSIKARTYFVRGLLSFKKFNEIEKNYNEYKKLNNKFILDDLKIWEHGEYNDIMLRYFFIKKDYLSLIEFLNTKVTNVEGPKIESDSGLYNLVQKYYFEYFDKNSSASEFDSFYKKYFIKKKHETNKQL